MQLTEKDRAETKIPQIPAQPFSQDCQDLLLCALAGLSLREVAAAEPHPEPKASKGAGAQTLRYRTALITLLSLTQMHPLQWKTSYFQAIFSLFNCYRKKSCSEMEVGHRVIALMERGAGRQSQTSAASFHLPELQTSCGLSRSQEVQ